MEETRYVRHNQTGERYAVTVDKVVDGWVFYLLTPTETGSPVFDSIDADCLVMHYTEDNDNQ